MEKEKLFLYRLFASLYRCGIRQIDIGSEDLKKIMPYLKQTIGDEIKDIEDLFNVDEEGIYTNYLKMISSLDPLCVERENNVVNFIMNDEMSNFFNDDNINYIGEKVAAYIKVKKKEKSFYENN